jgi:hypothetical protein
LCSNDPSQVRRSFPEQSVTIYELFNLLLLFTTEALSLNLTDIEMVGSLTDQGWSQAQADSYLKKFK